MPLLTTDRCILTHPEYDDIEELVTLYTDTEVRKYLGGPADAALLRQRIIARIGSSEHASYWIIRHARDGAFIGSVSLAPHHDGIRTEISYQLLPRWWRQGYATEVVHRVIAHAFADLGIPEIVAETQLANLASCRLLTRIGMHLEQTVDRFGARQGIFRIDAK